MSYSGVYRKGSEAAATDGVVHVTGPSNVEFEMTPRAAFETARNIDRAAIDAVLEQRLPSRFDA